MSAHTAPGGCNRFLARVCVPVKSDNKAYPLGHEKRLSAEAIQNKNFALLNLMCRVAYPVARLATISSRYPLRAPGAEIRGGKLPRAVRCSFRAPFLEIA